MPSTGKAPRKGRREGRHGIDLNVEAVLPGFLSGDNSGFSNTGTLISGVFNLFRP
jgi:hypothetical protein